MGDKKATQAPAKRGSGTKVKVGGNTVKTGTPKGKKPQWR